MSEWVEVEEPKIWASRFPRFLDVVSFDWTCRGEKLEFIRAFQNGLQKVEENSAPSIVYFARHNEIPISTKDAFLIKDGLRVISPALMNVLVQFDLSGVQLFEVQIHADETGTPSGLPNHYVLNVYGSKDALIPELSKNIEQRIPFGSKTQTPSKVWTPIQSREVVALRSNAGAGADIWRDPNLGRTLFFSDRLKQAIDASGLKTKALSFAPTRIFTNT